MFNQISHASSKNEQFVFMKKDKESIVLESERDTPDTKVEDILIRKRKTEYSENTFFTYIYEGSIPDFCFAGFSTFHAESRKKAKGNLKRHGIATVNGVNDIDFVAGVVLNNSLNFRYRGETTTMFITDHPQFSVPHVIFDDNVLWTAFYLKQYKKYFLANPNQNQNTVNGHNAAINHISQLNNIIEEVVPNDGDDEYAYDLVEVLYEMFESAPLLNYQNFGIVNAYDEEKKKLDVLLY